MVAAQPNRRLVPAALLALTTIGLALILYASGNHSAWVWHPPTWNFTPVYPSMPPQDDMQTYAPPNDLQPPATPSPWLRWVWIGLGIAVALVALFFLARWLYRLISALASANIERVSGRGASVPVAATLTPQEVTDAIDEALRRLDDARTPTDAVVAAWLALEQTAARRDMKRDPAQTVTEFTAVLLENSAAPARDTATLRNLYLQARFSELATTPTDVQQARAALEHTARAIEPRLREPRP